MSAADAFVGREFDYTAHDFERVRRLIRGRVGIALNDSKQNMVYNRLVKRLRLLAVESFSDYLALLDDAAHPEWQHFVNALTTNLSHFFREEYHFPILVEHMRALAGAGRAPLRVWSAAASTGEEPYSIAIALCEAFATMQPPVEILGTDIDTHVLEHAQRGVYAMERVEQIEPGRLKRFFLRGTGANAGHAKVRPELARLIQYRRLNLTEERWDLAQRFDAVFCRNVMIYFDKATQHQVLRRIHRVLAPDGLLFAGHSESFLHAAELFRPAGKTVYRPVAGA
ncbi:MAG TPA: CheR family methyltransferase [Burkholderiales bacterium]|nr:CheR family methyltransferase [Burkholderiales bacterium]